MLGTDDDDVFVLDAMVTVEAVFWHCWLSKIDVLLLPS
jgi:hypothetical protein